MPKIIETRVADKDRAIKELEQRQRATKQENQALHLSCCIKKLGNGIPQGKQQRCSDKHVNTHELKPGDEGAAHTFVFLRSEILTDYWTDGSRKGQHHGKGQWREAPDHGHSGDSVCAKFGHLAGDDRGSEGCR